MAPSSSLRRIAGLLREELPALSAGTVLLVAGAALSLVYPQGIRAIVDGAIAGRDPTQVTRIALLLVVIAVVQGLAIAGRHLLFSLAGERGVRRVRERLYASLLSRRSASSTPRAPASSSPGSARTARPSRTCSPRRSR